MMSLEAIRSASDRATRRAAGQRRVPYVPYDQSEIDRMPPIPFPFLGNHVPDGWEPVEDELYFVDSSGCGADNEPALSVRRFLQKLSLTGPAPEMQQRSNAMLG